MNLVTAPNHAAEPAALAARQAQVWQPYLDWAALAFDAPLRVTTGIIAIEQPASALDALRATVESLPDFELAAISTAAPAAGSLVLALALRAGRADAEATYSAALLEELYQAETWGEEKGAAARRAGIRAELTAAARFFQLLDGLRPPDNRGAKGGT